MARHNILGKAGEQKAVDFLVGKGYTLHELDWKHGHVDIDIIAEEKGEIVFVEVKTRSTTNYGNPEDAVDNKKIRRIVNAADVYIKLHDICQPVRFDIITLVGQEPDFTIEHIENAFYPPLWK